jgi:hypothetical protein
MTAILIANMKEGNSDYLYIAADSRVTSSDILVSDNNKKIFTREGAEKDIRHYATYGDVGPCDYFIDLVEAVALHDTHKLFFEHESTKNIRGGFGAYVVEVTPTNVQLYQIEIDESDSKDERGNRPFIWKLDLEELKLNPMVAGSGGAHVLAAFRALLNTEKTADSKELINLAFKSAASVVLSMNDKVDILRIKLPKQSKKRLL